MQVRAKNQFCEMLPANEQEEKCYGNWSDALGIRVADALPSAIDVTALPTIDASSSSTQSSATSTQSSASLTETTESKSSCMYTYIQSDINTVYTWTYAFR